MSNAPLGVATDPLTEFEPFDEENDETPGERRARVLAENDLRLLWQLRHIRESHGITQTALAKRMGVSQPALAAFESQGNDPRLSTIRRYAHALGVIVDHAIDIDGCIDEGVGVTWGSSRVVHLAGRSAERAVARPGWR